MNLKDAVLFKTIESLSPWECKKFEKWLASPVHNSRKDLLFLFEYLLSCANKALVPEPSLAFTRVFPNQTYDEKKLRHAMSWLLQQLNDFIAWQEYQLEQNAQRYYLVRNLRRRGLESGFKQQIKEARQVIESDQGISVERSLDLFRLYLEQYQWDITQKRAIEMPFQAMAESLTNYFTTKMLQLGCLYRTQEAMGKQSPETLPRIDAILKAFPPELSTDSNNTMLYYFGFQMLSEPTEKAWADQFTEMMQTYSHQLPLDEAKGLLLMVINHCIGRMNRGEKEYLDQVLHLYNIGLEKRFLLDHRGFLSKFTYNNILLAMIARQNWAAAASFLETYREQLAPDERAKIYAYNHAVLLFRQGDLSAAQEILRELSFTEPMYNLDARRMLLRIYYQENAHDALESLLESLLTWVRRHSEIGYHREMYRNLARFTLKLLRIPAGEHKRRQALAQKIKDTPLVADKTWLLSVLEKDLK